MKKIILTEKQEKIFILNALYENTQYTVDTDKVLLIKKFLDKNFKRASMSKMGNNGYPEIVPIVGLKDEQGNIVKNMTDKQLFDLIQDKFSNIYENNIQRDKFIGQVIKDWFYKKITKEGILSTNLY